MGGSGTGISEGNKVEENRSKPSLGWVKAKGGDGGLQAES